MSYDWFFFFWPSVTIFIFVIYCLKISWSPRDCSRFPFYCFEMGQKYNIHFTIIFLIDNTRYSFFITAETIFYIDEDIARFARRLQKQKYQQLAIINYDIHVLVYYKEIISDKIVWFLIHSIATEDFTTKVFHPRTFYI